MNHLFVNLTDNEIQQIDYLYIGKLMFREFDKHIDWNVIKQKQLLKTSHTKKMGHKIIANSKYLMLQPINTELMQQLDNKYFLKLTMKHGISEYETFDKSIVVQCIGNEHSV